MGNIDPNNTKQEKQIRGQASVRRALNKQQLINMQYQSHEMHEADKESGNKTSKSTGKSNQSSLFTTHSKSAGGNHRSVIFRPISHHSSVVFQNDKSVAHHSDDSVGPFRQTHQSPSDNVALISGHQSINLAQYNSHKPDSRLRYSQVMLEVVKSRSIVPSTTEFYLNRFLQRHGTTTEATQPLFLLSKIPADTSCELKSVTGPHVGEPRRIPITPSGEAAEEQKLPGDDQYSSINSTGYDIHRACETPSSAYTRKPDEIGADGFSSSRLAGGEGGGGGGGLFREEGAAAKS
ncbi:hypothetical protein F511_23446 [Dorcoceras hygrometricum]|uniref:Uncharacterized protein n=1 Tax=Dorcoceras hygrometricum TaxID=472368 RepID=A0A2Z7CQE6_9LAMI|nr:hypothetical protein F511_23446 [Dorcoceras hygrometricum]